MNELITINKTVIGNEETNSVNSREVYEYLGVETRYNDWIQRAIEKYDFEENIDYSKMSNDTSRRIDYIVTLDMAKELCMVSNTEKGRETRKYFIKAEKESRLNLPTSLPEALRMMADMEEEKIRAIADKQFMKEKVLEAVSDRDEAKKEIVDRDNTLDHIFDEDAGISVKEWAQTIFDQDGIKVGQNNLFKILRNLGYVTSRDALPYQRYVDQRLFTLLTYSSFTYGKEVPRTKMLVTPKGIEKITPEAIDHFNEYMR